MPRSVRSVGLVVLLLLGLGPRGASAETIDEMFEAGNAAYFTGHFDEAQAAYERLAKTYGVEDPALYYNLGNAAFKLDRLGEAVLYYKKALKYEPDATLRADIASNLDATRAALGERYRKDTSKAQFVFDESHGVAYSLFHLLGPRTVKWTFVGLWFLLFVALVGRRVLPRPEVRRGLGIAAIVVGVLAVIAGTFYSGAVVTNRKTTLGVVVAGDARLKEGRHPDAPEHEIPEGLEVRIVDARDPEWTRIELSNGQEGWVPPGAVGEI